MQFQTKDYTPVFFNREIKWKLIEVSCLKKICTMT